MEKHVVLITSRSFGQGSDEPIKVLLQNNCEVIRPPQGAKDITVWLQNELPAAEAVIAGLEPYNAELLALATRLKIISRYGVGYDKIDTETAQEKGIVVTITPGANSESVADMAFTLMLAAARSLCLMDAGVHAKAQIRPLGQEIHAKTLGVVGTGRIGKGVAKRAQGFDMRVLLYDAYPDEGFAQQIRAEYVSMDFLLRHADFISLHVPYEKSTVNMIDAAALQKMKTNAILVNTARGGIVDENALYNALKSGQITAAGLDVLMTEPPYESPLLQLPNCIISPHVSSNTQEAIIRMSMMAAQNVVDILGGKQSRYQINQ